MALDLSMDDPRLDGPATKQDVLALAQRLERSETTLLREFRAYARRSHIRTQALEVRLDLIEREIDDLKTRLDQSRD